MKQRPNLLAAEELPAPPSQRRSIRKRERMKAAGIALFGEKGYEATSIGDIARRAGVAVGAFYQHFRSKRQLLLVLMDELLEKLNAMQFRPAASGDMRESLRALLSAAFAQDLKYLGAYRAWKEAALSDAELARKESEIRVWTSGRIEAVFNALAQMPGSRPQLDIPRLALVMDEFFWSLLARASTMPKRELARRVEISADLIFHAIFVDAPLIAKRQARRK